jgi:nucleoside 2-deoxyribosyltransferase
MKSYIASRLENADKVNELAKNLKEAGMEQSYDWTTHGRVQKSDGEVIRNTSVKEANGVIDADVVIVALPGARGTHTELGIAIGLGKKIFVWGENEDAFMKDERTCSFYYHPLVTRVVGDITEITMQVRSYRVDQWIKELRVSQKKEEAK